MHVGQFRFAICNELFRDFVFRDACRQVRSLGFDGIELAPFTLSNDPAKLTAAQRRGYREAIVDEQLEFVGFHWLLAAPPGLQASSRDEHLRKHTWNYVRDLIDLCADLAAEGQSSRPVAVFGSPKQRSTHGGADASEAASLFAQEAALVAPHAEAANVTLLIEALPKSQSDVINTLAESAAIVERIGSPAVQTMFDVHNTEDETAPHRQLLQRFFPWIRHVHVNEMDGREPGMADYDFANLMGILSDLQYTGWVSMEAFDFSRDPLEVARRGMTRLRSAVASSRAAGSIA